jgi:hypothetical protein
MPTIGWRKSWSSTWCVFRGDDLLADLTDRDFTLNAMAVDLRGDLEALIDPLGGERDLVDQSCGGARPIPFLMILSGIASGAPECPA